MPLGSAFVEIEHLLSIPDTVKAKAKPVQEAENYYTELLIIHSHDDILCC